MKNLILKLPGILGAVSLLSLSAGAVPRPFTDIEGRTIKAELMSASETSVTVKLTSGRTADIEISRLSQLDKIFIEGWVAEHKKEEKDKADATAAAVRAAEITVKLTAFCKENLGKQVGNGECWTLANEAFNACGLHRPTGNLRVWGRLLDFKKEKLQAGDIVEYRSAVFAGGSHTGPEHTSVIVKVDRHGAATIAQQNWSGNKNVTEAGFNPEDLQSGEIMIYRPE